MNRNNLELNCPFCNADLVFDLNSFEENDLKNKFDINCPSCKEKLLVDLSLFLKDNKKLKIKRGEIFKNKAISSNYYQNNFSSGRIGRLEYFLKSLGYSCIFFALFFCWLFTFSTTGMYINIFSIFLGIGVPIIFVKTSCLTIKRLHDLNLSTVHFFISNSFIVYTYFFLTQFNFVLGNFNSFLNLDFSVGYGYALFLALIEAILFIINFIYEIFLLFVPGSNGLNNYGMPKYF